MPRIAVVFGTRPEIIKLAPIVRASRKFKSDIHLISTDQQNELNAIALNDHEMRPKFSLGLMKPNQTLNSFLSSALSALEPILAENDYSGVVVHGDTVTALAASLAAFNLNIPVFHIEAGLRSFDLQNPFPEEMNRKLISQLATLHFAPTDRAKANLENEGISTQSIYQVGNTIVDVINQVQVYNRERIASSNIILEFSQFSSNVLITVHRRENHEKIFELVNALKILSVSHPEVAFWIPVHPNPNVVRELEPLRIIAPNIKLVLPMDYFDFLAAMLHSNFLVTDSGGVQEEATVIKKYCLVLREFTERPELIDSGMGELVKFSSENIVQAIEKQLDFPIDLQSKNSPFGDGGSAERICSILNENSYL
jgi:UDP-N-acetylglucosamine 2-epimerase (non-hydrolysing)